MCIRDSTMNFAFVVNHYRLFFASCLLNGVIRSKALVFVASQRMARDSPFSTAILLAIGIYDSWWETVFPANGLEYWDLCFLVLVVGRDNARARMFARAVAGLPLIVSTFVPEDPDLALLFFFLPNPVAPQWPSLDGGGNSIDHPVALYHPENIYGTIEWILFWVARGGSEVILPVAGGVCSLLTMLFF